MKLLQGRFIKSTDHDFLIQCEESEIKVLGLFTEEIHTGDWVRVWVKEEGSDCFLEKIELATKSEGELKIWNAFHQENALKFRTIKKKSELLRWMRGWFFEEGFIEFETPLLVPIYGAEPHLFGFKTRLESHPTQSESLTSKEFHLPSSPEFHMKRGLVAGFEKIFQISKCFRNGEFSSLHQPEFTMLEWYRTHENYEKLMEDCESLITFISKKLNLKNFELPWTRLTVSDAFYHYTGFELPHFDDLESMKGIAEKLGIVQSGSPALESYEDLFHLIFLNKIEPNLGKGKPCFLMDYPSWAAALSQVKKENPLVSERVELYINGIELSNGFTELTDWREQKKRFEKDRALRKALYGLEEEEDTGFIEALKEGMPPSAGMALGVDRLLMVLLGESCIDLGMAFPKNQDGI